MIYHLRFLFLFLIIACCGIAAAQAQEAGNVHTIRLKGGNITPAGNARAWVDSMAVAPVAKEPVQALVHFNTLPTKGQRAVLQQGGITLLDYIPDNTFSAIFKFPLDRERVLSVPIHSIINMQPEMKADDYLWRKVDGQKGGVEVMVSFYRGLDARSIREFIAHMGGSIDNGPMEAYGAYKVVIAAARLHTLAQWYGVRYISPAAPVVPLDVESMPAR